MKKMKRTIALIISASMVFSFTACNPDYEAQQQETEASWSLSESDMVRYNALKTHLENAITYGRDKTGKETPMFACGVNVDTKEPAIWKSNKGEDIVMGNFATVQNLLRALDSMTKFTGNPKYEKAGVEATKYMFKNYASDIGLLYWGGHIMIDLATEKMFTTEDYRHELKVALPHYEFMGKADKDGTVQFLESMWRAHLIFRDGRMLLNRHAYLTAKYNESHPEKPFELDYTQDFPVLFSSKKLSFMNISVDLIHAATSYYLLTGDERALEWAKTVIKMYEKASNPDTGLLPYIYNFTGGDESAPIMSTAGDDIFEQLGDEFGIAGSSPYYLGNIGYESTVNANLPMAIFDAYEKSGEKFSDMKDMILEKMLLFKKYAYISETGMFKPILGDGTDLTGYVHKTDGYAGSVGDTYEQAADTIGNLFTAYLRAYTYSENTEFWDVVRGTAKTQGLGDLGTNPGENMDLNMETDSTNAVYLMGLVEIYEDTKVEAYRDLARKIGDNIVENGFQNGFLTKGKEYLYSRFEDLEAIALSALHASLIGEYDKAPEYIGQRPHIEGYMMIDGVPSPDGNMTDAHVFKIKR